MFLVQKTRFPKISMNVPIIFPCVLSIQICFCFEFWANNQLNFIISPWDLSLNLLGLDTWSFLFITYQLNVFRNERSFWKQRWLLTRLKKRSDGRTIDISISPRFQVFSFIFHNNNFKLWSNHNLFWAANLIALSHGCILGYEHDPLVVTLRQKFCHKITSLDIHLSIVGIHLHSQSWLLIKRRCSLAHWQMSKFHGSGPAIALVQFLEHYHLDMSQLYWVRRELWFF